MAKSKNATVIILDVVRSANDPDDSFFQNAKKCVDRILHRKMFSAPYDEVSLVLMSSATTANNCDYRHLCTAFEMQCTHWHMLEMLESQVQRGAQAGDWLEAINVALGVLEQNSARKFVSHKIVLLSAFQSGVKSDLYNRVVDQQSFKDIDLMVITDKLQCNSDGDLQFRPPGPAATDEEIQSKRLIMQCIEERKGVICDFDEALLQLIYYEKKRQKSMPWNCRLDFGSSMHVNVAAYIRVRETPAEPWKCDYQIRYKYYLNNRQLPDDEVVRDLTKGLLYSGEPVAHDAVMNEFRSQTRKCLSVIGFVDRAQFADQHFTGNGSWSVVAQPQFAVSERMLVALVRAMRSAKLAMVARYVYRDGLAPKLMVLMADDDDAAAREYGDEDEAEAYKSRASLSMRELVYNNCIAIVYVPPLTGNRHVPTKEQCDAVDKLIDAMDLMHALPDGDDDGEQSTEAFPFSKLLDPFLQHTYRVISHRAMHPDTPIPAIDADLTSKLSVPAKLKAAAAEPLARIQELFPLQTFTPSTDITKIRRVGKLMSDLQGARDAHGNATVPPSEAQAGTGGDGDQNATGGRLTCVGSVTPAEDFAELLLAGERYSLLADQLRDVLHQLVLRSVHVPVVKICRAMLMYREEAMLLGPHRYNDFVAGFRAMLFERQRVDLWQQIVVQERLGLITVLESDRSAVEEAEAIAFLQLDATGGGAPKAVERPRTSEQTPATSDAGAAAPKPDTLLDDLLDMM